MSGVSGIVVVMVQATLAPIPKQPAYGGGEISPLMEHMSAAMEKVCLFPGSSDFGSVISLGVHSNFSAFSWRSLAIDDHASLQRHSVRRGSTLID
jgi:hypothetical protein